MFFFYGYLRFTRSYTQTTVTNIYKLILENNFYLTFRMLPHTFSDVSFKTKLEFKYTDKKTFSNTTIKPTHAKLTEKKYTTAEINRNALSKKNAYKQM
mgnify:CR=1 FL=1